MDIMGNHGYIVLNILVFEKNLNLGGVDFSQLLVCYTVSHNIIANLKNMFHFHIILNLVAYFSQ